MNVLVINNGSSSSRFYIINVDNDAVLASGGAENIGSKNSYYKYENNRGYKTIDTNIILDNNQAFEKMCQFIFDKNVGVLNYYKDIDVIGHRVVHGGEFYTKATYITDDVKNNIKNLSLMAPIHNNSALETIEKCITNFKNIDNIGVFDTAFHHTIPKENYLYAIPSELYYKYKIRKYGFHGTSYKYVLNRYCELYDKEKNNINSVICHSSMCAIKNGQSFDTTMGYTPLSGLIMSSRSGNVDPSIISDIMKIYNISIDEAINILNFESGYYGICGEKDAKKMVENSLKNDANSILLRKMINNDFKKNFLSMMSCLDKIDSIIITGGMGAKNKEQRQLFLENLNQFGINLDIEKNEKVFDIEAVISSNSSRIPIYVIPTNEEKQIANECKQLIKRR